MNDKQEIRHLVEIKTRNEENLKFQSRRRLAQPADINLMKSPLENKFNETP
ncbi:MAG: hypothetical protein M3Q78_02475 [Acidobacteriota bacterium]|nr:hypothetical protein [Acidobacteriota bacterium]